MQAITGLACLPLALAEGGGVMEMLNFPLVFSSLVGFLILFFTLKRFMWGPVLNVIDERAASIEQAFAEVDSARDEVAAMKADYEKKLADFNAQAQRQLQEAVEKGQQIAAEIKAGAEEQREKLLARTHEDIAREKDKAIAELRSAAVGLSFDIAQRVLKQDLDRERHDKLVAGFVDDLKRLN